MPTINLRIFPLDFQIVFFRLIRYSFDFRSLSLLPVFFRRLFVFPSFGNVARLPLLKKMGLRFSPHLLKWLSITSDNKLAIAITSDNRFTFFFRTSVLFVAVSVTGGLLEGACSFFSSWSNLLGRFCCRRFVWDLLPTSNLRTFSLGFSNCFGFE